MLHQMMLQNKQTPVSGLPVSSPCGASEPAVRATEPARADLNAMALTELDEIRVGILRLSRHRTQRDGGLLELGKLNVFGLETESAEPAHRGALIEAGFEAGAEYQADPECVPDIDAR